MRPCNVASAGPTSHALPRRISVGVAPLPSDCGPFVTSHFLGHVGPSRASGVQIVPEERSWVG